MEIKIGDFGLATKLEHDKERKNSCCGTPNYMAPEVLNKTGHSFEVDAWSLGCIMYTLLIGNPPFETNCLEDTFALIQRAEYHVPSEISKSAKTLISKLLQGDPNRRASMVDVLQNEFVTQGWIPSKLPVSCMCTAPRVDDSVWDAASRSEPPRKPLAKLNKAAQVAAPKQEALPKIPNDYHLTDLLHILQTVISSKPSEKRLISEEDAEDPASIPVYWVSHWVDYTGKYGVGYKLCDNSVGVLFDDNTKIILLEDGFHVHYIEDATEHYYTTRKYPDALKKKITLLEKFMEFMDDHLLKAGENVQPKDIGEFSRLPYLRVWFRTRIATVMHLTKGTLQLNLVSDNSKIVLCPLMEAVTFINQINEIKTYKLRAICQSGCDEQLVSRLKYTKTIVEKFLVTKVKPPTKTAAH